MKVTPKDVIIPCIILLGLNVLVLTLWTALSPLVWDRYFVGNIDKFGRDLESVGRCNTTEGKYWGPYFWTLASINFAMVLLANFQAYQSRHLSVEFSESEHVAMIMAAVLQALVIGIPLVVIVERNPISLFVVKSLLVFIICFTFLLVMFIPKMLHLKEARIEAKKKAERIAEARKRDTAFQLRRSETTLTEEDGLAVHHPKLEQDELRSLKAALDEANDREKELRQRIARLVEEQPDNPCDK
mmetsp:Transcript_35246/g.65274  ORF Transcript_35246/g.65274 Transcript_35246/m.65274 type:complete len:243 (+) Transcript_35246:2-730(+)